MVELSRSSDDTHLNLPLKTWLSKKQRNFPLTNFLQQLHHFDTPYLASEWKFELRCISSLEFGYKEQFELNLNNGCIESFLWRQEYMGIIVNLLSKFRGREGKQLVEIQVWS